MLIDWFTVGAQVLNFVLLVWLMKRFLYQPVLDAIAAREKRIAGQIADAASKESQATAERKSFEDKNTAFDQQRAGLLDKAKADAAAEAQRLEGDARKAAIALAAKREQALATQAENLQQMIAERAAHEVFAVARKTLADLANVDLEERISEVFMRHLSALTAPAKDQFEAALKQSAEPALVRSHFALSGDQQAAIGKSINAAFSTDVPLRFETAADGICGVELSAGGQKVAWTIDVYLRDLEHNVAMLLAPAAKPVAAPKSPDASLPTTGRSPRADPVGA
ncbi:MAG: F0F1 ATP synthase subunit B [Burkholderiaceae bacterium]